MWDPHNNGPFAGKHYLLAETLCSPQPIHRPPVLIGGGERKSLRLVARYVRHGDPTTGSPARRIEGMAPAVARLADLG
jgi:alkanesulfonate monooxygenase SsuD/methylene tetrahydromethanopterin reductase-like flavin-dependent oxidoreductase (luciferase family)